MHPSWRAWQTMSMLYNGEKLIEEVKAVLFLLITWKRTWFAAKYSIYPSISLEEATWIQSTEAIISSFSFDYSKECMWRTWKHASYYCSLEFLECSHWWWHQSSSCSFWTLAFPTQPRNCCASGFSNLERHIHRAHRMSVMLRQHP